MATILQSLPVGEKGRHRVLRRPRHQRRAALDAREGRDSLRLHRQPRPARRARLRRHPAQGAGSTAPRRRACRLPRRSSSPKGIAALQCGAFHISTAGVTYFNTTPLGRAVTGTMLVVAMKRGRRPHLGRRQHVQGQRHRALLPLRPARQPAACASTSRGSTSSSSTSSAAARRCRSTCATRGFGYKMSAEKAYSTDSNMLGATHEAKDLELLDTGITIVEPIMGVAFWRDDVAVKRGDGDGALRRRPAGRAQRHARSPTPVDADARGQRASAAATASA